MPYYKYYVKTWTELTKEGKISRFGSRVKGFTDRESEGIKKIGGKTTGKALFMR